MTAPCSVLKYSEFFRIGQRAMAIVGFGVVRTTQATDVGCRRAQYQIRQGHRALRVTPEYRNLENTIRAPLAQLHNRLPGVDDGAMTAISVKILPFYSAWGYLQKEG